MPAVPQKKQAQPATLVPYYKSECGRVVVYKGDCREVMKRLEAESLHAIVSDPPYGLEFMGKDWDAPWKADGGFDPRDKTKLPESQRRIVAASVTYGTKSKRNNGKIEVCDEGMDPSHPFRDGTNRVVYGTSDTHGFQVWFQTCADEMLRVCKPGAHCLTFGGTRMFHRMACAVEDAGWEIRDVVMWVYGSGFPKSHDVSKAIDKAYGVEREIIGTKQAGMAPATEDGLRWQGWGTALKPAYEPCILSRKPLIGTVAQNVLEHGTGGINIDECRVGADGGCKHIEGTGGFDAGIVNALGGHLNSTRSPSAVGLGRWPANIILSYPDDKYELRDDVTPDQLRQLADWMHENENT